MFECVQIPKKVEKSPITQAVYEIRFNSEIEKEIIYYNFLQVISNELKTTANELPFNKVPDFIRNGDPYMRYQPCYRFQNDNHVVQFSQYSLIFSYLPPYDSWQVWYDMFAKILNGIKDSELAPNLFIERIGIRYIDVIEGLLRDNCKVSYLLGDQKYEFSDKKIKFRAELCENDKAIILKIKNLQKRDNMFDTLIDIDVIKKYEHLSFSEYLANDFKNLFELHEISKQYFFGLLSDNSLEKLGAQY